MKILTLNTWQERGPWPERWEIILSGMKEFAPDVVAFQEVFNADWAREAKKRVGFANLVFPKEPGGLMLLSQFAVREWECITLKTKSPTEDYLRYALYAELDAGGRAVAVFNTHLSWKLDEGAVREKQVEELLEFIQKKAGEKTAFVMGDFNAPPETPEIRKMIRGGFVDLFALKNPGDPGLTWNNRNPFTAGSSVPMPDRRIDYIWRRGETMAEVKSAELVYTEPAGGLYASDHFGILAHLRHYEPAKQAKQSAF